MQHKWQPSFVAGSDLLIYNPDILMIGQGQNIKAVSDHSSSNLVMPMIDELPDGRETYQDRSH